MAEASVGHDRRMREVVVEFGADVDGGPVGPVGGDRLFEDATAVCIVSSTVTYASFESCPRVMPT